MMHGQKNIKLFVLSGNSCAGVSEAAVIWKLTYEGGTRHKTRRNNKDVCAVTLLLVHFSCLGKGDCSGGIF